MVFLITVVFTLQQWSRRPAIACSTHVRRTCAGAAAGLPRDRLALVQDEQGRHRLHLEPPTEPWVLVDVDLDELDLSGEVPGDLFESWADHAAGAAPGGPEVDYDGHRGVVSDLGEVAVARVDDPGQGLLAVAASGPSLGGHGNPVAATAVRAGHRGRPGGVHAALASRSSSCWS